MLVSCEGAKYRPLASVGRTASEIKINKKKSLDNSEAHFFFFWNCLCVVLSGTAFLCAYDLSV